MMDVRDIQNYLLSFFGGTISPESDLSLETVRKLAEEDKDDSTGISEG